MQHGGFSEEVIKLDYNLGMRHYITARNVKASEKLLICRPKMKAPYIDENLGILPFNFAICLVCCAQFNLGDPLVIYCSVCKWPLCSRSCCEEVCYC